MKENNILTLSFFASKLKTRNSWTLNCQISPDKTERVSEQDGISSLNKDFYLIFKKWNIILYLNILLFTFRSTRKFCNLHNFWLYGGQQQQQQHIKSLKALYEIAL